jgi:hypothetical protein
VEGACHTGRRAAGSEYEGRLQCQRISHMEGGLQCQRISNYLHNTKGLSKGQNWASEGGESSVGKLLVLLVNKAWRYTPIDVFVFTGSPS